MDDTKIFDGIEYRLERREIGSPADPGVVWAADALPDLWLTSEESQQYYAERDAELEIARAARPTRHGRSYGD